MPPRQTIESAIEARAPEALVRYEAVREFLRVALARFKLAAEAEEQVRREALDDLQFSVGQQWPPDIEELRLRDGRPVLTINRLPQFIRQVTNEQRQQRPAVQVNPVGDGADVDTAEVLQGIIRHVEVNSDAEIAYDHGFDMQSRIGFGYWRLLTEYVDGNPNEQEIKIKRIKNPFSVYFDPTCAEPDYSDALWAFIIYDISRELFAHDYPGASALSLTDFLSVGDLAPRWITKDTIRVAEYFYVEGYGETDAKAKESAPEGVDTRGAGTGAAAQPVAEAGAESSAPLEKPGRRVRWAKITALDVLDRKNWLGKWIPIVPVLGDDLDVNGRRHLAGLVRHAKDPQRLYNYWQSSAAEMIALAPKAPFVGAEGQFENQEERWRTANQRTWAYLEYKPISVSGQPVPPPQRQVFEPPVQALVGMIRLADNDLKATTGIYDASLGREGPESSGKAILARQKQTDISILNFSDNLARSLRFTARQLLDLIPKIYPPSKVQRIIKPDGTVQHVGIFSSGHMRREDAQGLQEFQGMKKIYDIGVGRYDVTVSVGPSYQSKRQEAAASMMALVSSYPQVFGLIGDLLVRNMDWPHADEIAKRLKMALPPNLQEQSDQDDPRAVATTLRGQLAAMSQQHELLVKELNALSEIVRTKKMDLDSRERIAVMQNQTNLISAELKARSEGALEAMKAEFTVLAKRLDQLLAPEAPGLQQPSASVLPQPAVLAPAPGAPVSGTVPPTGQVMAGPTPAYDAELEGKPTILLVRHGDIAHNRDGRVRGWINAPLIPEGEEQMRKVAKKLRNVPVAAIFHDRLERSTQSARILGDELGIEPEAAEGLRPRNVARLAGRKIADVKDELRYYDQHPDEAIPGGESSRDFHDRWGQALDALKSVAERHRGKAVVAVVHESNIMTAPALAAGKRPDPRADFQAGPGPGTISELSKGEDGKWSMS